MLDVFIFRPLVEKTLSLRRRDEATTADTHCPDLPVLNELVDLGAADTDRTAEGRDAVGELFVF